MKRQRRTITFSQLARLHKVNSIKSWDELSFWKSGEWQVVEERLDEFDLVRKSYNPDRELLFAALDEVPLEKVKVMWVGQDPYPNKRDACGVAFAVKRKDAFPPTLQTIFKEYCDDLHYPEPTSGDLSQWCREGVLLWNAYPSCFTGQPGSHHWPEWEFLTAEIISKVQSPRIPIVFSGNSARQFVKYAGESPIIETAHPSPRGNRHSHRPFSGSRLFSTINSKLVSLKQEPINWRLE